MTKTPRGEAFYDNHSLYINVGVATNEQLSSAIRQALVNTSKILGRRLKTKFKVNVVDVRGVHLGYAHVFFTNPEVYNMLIGLNPDGSDRVEYIDDPEWEGLVSQTDDEVIDYDTFLSGQGKSSWADLMIEEEARQRPKLKQPLDPLMVLPPYEYDPDQMEHIRSLVAEQALRAGNTTVPVVPTHGRFEVERAYTTNVDPKYSHNILCSREIPKWIDEDDLKKVFQPYASDTETLHARKVYGRSVKEAYPFITINEKRIAFITFDPMTRDAQFALMMTKRVELSRTDLGVKAQLTVSHAYKTKQ